MNILEKNKLFFKKAFIVNNEDDELGWADIALGIISGAAIGYGLYKLFKGNFYTCPNCGFKAVPNNALNCPKCGTRLKWQ